MATGQKDRESLFLRPGLTGKADGKDGKVKIFIIPALKPGNFGIHIRLRSAY
jgi:hypothetical protein